MAVYLGQNEVILRNGISTTDADATAADILVGKTAYVNDIKIIGTNFILVKKDVNFYDYDGTLVAGYTIVEAQALSALPTAPTHTDLTFQEWNHTLAQVKATTTPLNVGATYITTDGKTHLHINPTTASGLSVPLYFGKSDTSELTIDWGDGNTSKNTTVGSQNIIHTYATAGYYIIKMWMSSGSGTYSLGNGSAATVTIGGATSAYRKIHIKAFIGSLVTLSSACLSTCSSLVECTLPRGQGLPASGFNQDYGLPFLTIPIGAVSLPTGFIGLCYNMRNVSIPKSVTSIASGAVASGYSLNNLIIPEAVASIDATAFQNNLVCMKYVFTKTSPPLLLNTTAFTGISSICKIYVPDASVSAYQTATNWSTYANYIEGY